MRIIIFGGSGFLGSALANTYRKMGFEDVFQLSRINNVDLTKLEVTTNTIKEYKPDIIVNCTAYVGSVHYGMGHPAEIVYINSVMTLNLYKAIEESKIDVTVINPIPNCTYPSNADIQKEENWWDGSPHYSALSYASARRIIYPISLAFHQQHGIKSKNFLLCGLYGPGNHIDENRIHALDGLIVRMTRAKMNNDKLFEVWGTGKPVREWCFINDIAELICRGSFLEKEIIYPINIGQQKGYSISDTVDMIKKALSFKGKIYFNKEYEDGALKKILSNKNFKKIFPNYKFTHINDGIQLSVNYYKDILK